MKAVILAAGKGKRMRPLTLKTPKPLLHVHGKVFLAHILDSLPAGVNEIVIVIGYKGEQIKRFLEDKYKDKKIHYVVQKTPDGTGSALLLTRSYFNRGERFLLIYADELVTKKEVKKCLSHKFSWLTRYYDRPEESGVATLNGKKIIDVMEKPKRPASHFVVAGLMVINADVFLYKPVRHKNGEYYVTSMMKKFLKSHNVISVPGRDNLSFSTKEEVDKFNKSQ